MRVWPERRGVMRKMLLSWEDRGVAEMSYELCAVDNRGRRTATTMWSGRLVKTAKAAGSNWVGVNTTGFSGTEPCGLQIQRDRPGWRMNTSMGPNGVCADRSANAAGSVIRLSCSSAAYLDRHWVVAPADVS